MNLSIYIRFKNDSNNRD